MSDKITSVEIKKALAASHDKDFFMTEVKNGSSYFPPAQGLLIFDGIAITRSYTRPCIKIYEIKVSRGDFLRDNKWNLYKQYCNELYFVVPKGMIDKSELPDDVGLIYYNRDGVRNLITKRKAQYRDIDEPVGVYKYIIYSRLEPDRIPFYRERKEYAEDYLKDIKDRKYVGYNLGTKLAKQLQDAERMISEIEGKIHRLEILDIICEKLDKCGLNPFGWKWRMDRVLTTPGGETRRECIEEYANALEARLNNGVDIEAIELLESDINLILQRLHRMKNNGENKGDNNASDKGGTVDLC